MPSFYYPDFTDNDKRIILQGDEHHHLVHVKRKNKGDSISILNGKGLIADCTISEISKKKTLCEVSSITIKERSETKLSAAFSLLKNKNDHLIVEKLTELGVSEFFPIVTDRTIKRPKGSLVSKFTATALSAIKQCDNPFLPLVHEHLDLKDFVERSAYKGIQLLTALETEEQIFLKDIKLTDNICILIGPEGGFSKEEELLLRTSNITCLSLGKHILRAETAAICFASQIICFYQMRDTFF